MVKLSQVTMDAKYPVLDIWNTQYWAWEYPVLDMGIPSTGHGNTQYWTWEYPVLDIWNTQYWAWEYPVLDMGIPSTGHGNTQYWTWEYPVLDMGIPSTGHGYWAQLENCQLLHICCRRCKYEDVILTLLFYGYIEPSNFKCQNVCSSECMTLTCRRSVPPSLEHWPHWPL